MKAMQLNNKRKEIVYSRHTSMVAKDLEEGNISNYLKKLRKKSF